MYGGMGKAFSGMFIAMFVTLCMSVPLGIWKLIEIIIWICHLKITIE